MNKLPERLREALRERNLQQKQLAEGIGCSEASVSHWLDGSRTPRVDTFLRAAQYLEVSAGWLLGLSDEGGTEHAE